jgi:hypothetical protein
MDTRKRRSDLEERDTHVMRVIRTIFLLGVAAPYFRTVSEAVAIGIGLVIAIVSMNV